MKFSLVIILIITLTTSCKRAADLEMQALQEIIDLDSSEVVIWENLIPLKIDKSKGYQDYVKEFKVIKGEIQKPPRTGNEVVPDAPPIMQNESVLIGAVLFRRLLMKDQFKEEDYIRIRHFVVKNDWKTRKINSGKVTDISIIDIWNGGTGIEKFREYGYPILVGDRLIVYSNTYTLNENFSSGLGKFDIYDRVDGQWKKIESIIKWIT